MNRHSPDFDDLVDPEVGAAERDRLRRVHDLLLIAGPPPDVSSWSAPATEAATASPRRGRRRRGALLALAAALGVVAAFTIGLAVAAGDDESPERVIAMSGPGGATGSLEVYEIDAAGNWPMLFEVEDLPRSSAGKLLELWLTKDGEPEALCGSFLAEPGRKTVVPMNAPWNLSRFDGWVVVEKGSRTALLTT